MRRHWETAFFVLASVLLTLVCRLYHNDWQSLLADGSQGRLLSAYPLQSRPPTVQNFGSPRWLGSFSLSSFGTDGFIFSESLHKITR
jgi:hypothetical protein